MAVDRARRVYVAGHTGMVGSALLRCLEGAPGMELLTRSHGELDLTRQAEVEAFLAEEAVDEVYIAAAHVGGILANDRYPADFIYRNLMIEANLVHAAFSAGVRRLLMLGSSCIYPREAPQPMAEDSLLTGPLEPTNEAYAVAKIAGLKLCEAYNRQHGTDYRSVMPTNLYGPHDNFDPESGHVIPGLLRRFRQAVLDRAAYVEVWGSGRPRREFLHVDDLAAACRFVMELPAESYRTATNPRCSHLNVGCGRDLSIAELAHMIAGIAEFGGEIRFRSDRPDGAPRKLLDVGRMTRLGWEASIPLKQGLRDTWRWMVDHWDAVRSA